MSLMRRQGQTVLVATITALVVSGAPAVGSAMVEFARNAGKVDGFDAVKAGARPAARKGVLVATSPKSGRLPNNIIATAPNASKLDGKDSTRFATKAALGARGTINEKANPVHWSRLKGVPTPLMDGNDAIGPRAFGHVDDAGFVDRSTNLDNQNVDHPAGQTGVYCFNLGFTPQHVQVTTDRRLTSSSPPPTTDPGAQPFASFSPAALTANCSPDDDAVVIFRADDGTAHNASFFVSFM
jgi:hypothetical protein